MKAEGELQFRRVLVDGEGPRNPHIKAVGDLDGDGCDEIVVASSAGGPLVWYDGPNWIRNVIAPAGEWSCDAKVVDMTGNGRPDVVISEWYGRNRLEWYENPGPDGDPAFDPWERHIVESPRAHDLLLGDVDGDGTLEIATRDQGKSGNRFILLKRDGGGWKQRVLPCPAGEGLAVGDLTGTGRLDVVIGGRWFEAPQDIMAGDWAEHVFAEWPEDSVVRVADMNADGRLDVVLTRSEGPHRISWFEPPADPRSGGWTEHLVGDDVDFAHSLQICDLNGDGLPDVVTAEMHQSKRRRVMVYLNLGGGEWHQQILTETGSHNMCVADLDGSGVPAIVGANWSGDFQPVEAWVQPVP